MVNEAEGKRTVTSISTGRCSCRCLYCTYSTVLIEWSCCSVLAVGHILQASLAGQGSAILEMGDKSKRGLSLAGFSGWLAWRSAYLTRLHGVRNRLYVMINWTTTLLFGRDLSRF